MSGREPTAAVSQELSLSDNVGARTQGRPEVAGPLEQVGINCSRVPQLQRLGVVVVEEVNFRKRPLTDSRRGWGMHTSL